MGLIFILLLKWAHLAIVLLVRHLFLSLSLSLSLSLYIKKHKALFMQEERSKDSIVTVEMNSSP